MSQEYENQPMDDTQPTGDAELIDAQPIDASVIADASPLHEPMVEASHPVPRYLHDAIPPQVRYQWIYWGFDVIALSLGLFAGVLPGIVYLAIRIEIAFFLISCRELPLLKTIRTAARQGIALEPVLDAFAAESAGSSYRYRMRALCGLLRGGEPFPSALAAVGGLVSGRTLTYLRVGREVNRQPETIDYLCDPLSQSLRGVQRDVVYRLGLILCFMVWFLGMYTFFSLWIAPKMMEIMYDFDMDLPWLAQSLMQMSTSQGLHSLVSLVLLATVVVGFFFMLRFEFGVSWVPFGMRWCFRRSEGADIMGLLGHYVATGRPISEAVDFLADSYHCSWIRPRLQRAAARIRAGDPWSEVLVRSGLIRRVDRALLDSAEQNGNLAWALSELSQSVRRRTLHRLSGMVQVIFVGFILMMGLLTLIFSLNLFLFLTKMVEYMA